MATRITSTIEPIVDSLRRTWSGAATPAHSADSTTAAWSNQHSFRGQSSFGGGMHGGGFAGGMHGGFGGGMRGGFGGGTAASVAAVCMAEAEEATGNRICVRANLYSKKIGMEVSRMMRYKR